MDQGLPVGVTHNIAFGDFFFTPRRREAAAHRLTPSFDLLPSPVGSRRSRDEGRSWGYLGRALSQNPCNIFGNCDRDDGDRDGNSYLLDDGHAKNGSTHPAFSASLLSARMELDCMETRLVPAGTVVRLEQTGAAERPCSWIPTSLSLAAA